MQQAISDRIGLGPGANLVHEAFVSECVLDSQRRTKRASKERRPYRMGQRALYDHRSFGSAAPVDAAREVCGNNVALIAKFSLWGFRRSRLKRFGLVAQ